MAYFLYLYSIKVEGYINLVNFGLSNHFSQFRGQVREGFNYLQDFDHEAVSEKLLTELNGKAKVHVERGPRGMNQSAFIKVVTSAACASEVIPGVMAAACRNKLIYFDPQLDKTLCPGPYYDNSKVRVKERTKQICAYLRENWDGKIVWHMNHICSIHDYLYEEYYVITVRKPKEGNIADGIMGFFSLFRSCLLENEKLLEGNKGFLIRGENYSITFYIEGYKGHADLVWYMRNGKIVSEMPHRMSYLQMRKWLLSAEMYDREDTLARLHFNEMIRDYRNVLDRLAASIRLTKKLKKLPVRISIGPIVRHNGFFILPFGDSVQFHAYPGEDHYRDEKISLINIDEDDVSYIYLFAGDLLPYAGERFYDHTHYPFEIMKDVVERLKTVREILVYDPYSNLLNQYLRDDYSQWNREQLAERRFDIVAMLDVLLNGHSNRQIYIAVMKARCLLCPGRKYGCRNRMGKRRFTLVCVNV